MLNTRRTKRTFSPEFRLEAIEQVVKYQRDVREVALALELNPDYLRKWIRLYKQELQGIEPAGNAFTHGQRYRSLSPLSVCSGLSSWTESERTCPVSLP